RWTIPANPIARLSLRLQSHLISLPHVHLAQLILFIKAKRYDWRPHEDNTRAFTKPSIIWQLGDEYERRGNSHRKQYWRCGHWWDRGLIQQLEDADNDLQGSASEVIRGYE